MRTGGMEISGIDTDRSNTREKIYNYPLNLKSVNHLNSRAMMALYVITNQ